jgi:hypothetical protein
MWFYLNPDIEVIAEVNTPASFETFGDLINTSYSQNLLINSTFGPKEVRYGYIV